MCVCVCVVCMYVYICAHIWACVCVSMCVYVCVCVCVCVFVLSRKLRKIPRFGKRNHHVSMILCRTVTLFFWKDMIFDCEERTASDDMNL